MLIAVSLLWMILVGSIGAKDCDGDKFSACIAALEHEDFKAVDKEQMEEVCNSRNKSLHCVSDYIQNCVNSTYREVYEATTSGKLEVVQKMCTQGTPMNQGFLANAECFRKISDDVGFCSDKFKESQLALSKSADLDDKTKFFYGCCAFEWHRKCLSSAARAKCGEEASDFVYHVTTTLGGQLQEMLCSTSYPSCHGLHGVEVSGDNAGMALAPLTPLLAGLLLLTM